MGLSVILLFNAHKRVLIVTECGALANGLARHKVNSIIRQG
jgi:hypothetical protein